MPKSTKQKQAKVADFSKTKTKLGKGKQAASNATDTSYKARSIVLPNQSITEDKRDDSEPTTRRNHNLQDLLVQTKHYNVGVRKDALQGLKELFQAHPSLLVSSLKPFLTHFVRLLPDPESQVRALLPPLLSTLLPSVPTSAIQPHLPLLLLHSTSTLSHIYPEVRLSAVRLIHCLLDISPDIARELVTGESSPRVLDGLLGTLGLGGSSDIATASKGEGLNGKNKKEVLSCLEKFLKARQGNGIIENEVFSAKNMSWAFLQGSFISQDGSEAFEDQFKIVASTSNSSKMAARYPTWGAASESAMDNSRSSWEASEIFSDLSEAEQASSTSLMSVSQSTNTSIGNLYLTLHPLLLSTFLDSAPNAFSPTSTSILDLELVSCVVEIASLLGGVLMSSSSPTSPSLPAELEKKVKDSFRTLLGKAKGYFPFNRSYNFGRTDLKTENLHLTLSLSYSYLLASVMSPTVLLPPPLKSSNLLEKRRVLEVTYAEINHLRKKNNTTNEEEMMLVKVVEWVEGLLTGVDVSLTGSLTKNNFARLCPTIWGLLNQPPSTEKGSDINSGGNVQQRIFTALLSHHSRLSPTSGIKPISLGYIARLCLLELSPLYRGIFRLPTQNLTSKSSLPTPSPEVSGFWDSLLRTLWELGGTKDVSMSNAIIQLLLIRSNSTPTTSAQQQAHTSTLLTPYFWISHSTRGELPGPWAKLPLDGVRKKALELARCLGGADLKIAVAKAVSGKPEEGYWRRINEVVF